MERDWCYSMCVCACMCVCVCVYVCMMLKLGAQGPYLRESSHRRVKATVLGEPWKKLWHLCTAHCIPFTQTVYISGKGYHTHLHALSDRNALLRTEENNRGRKNNIYHLARLNSLTRRLQTGYISAKWTSCTSTRTHYHQQQIALDNIRRYINLESHCQQSD